MRARALYGRAFQARVAPLSALSGQFRRYEAEACRALPSRRRSHAVSAPVRNVFGLRPRTTRANADAQPQPLRLVALGTVEPRKNFRAAAKILAALRAQGFPDATLDIVGRPGWGDDWQMLENHSGRYAARLSVRRTRQSDCSTPPTCSSARPMTKAWGCRCWRRNMPAFRSSRRMPPSSARCSASPASTSIRRSCCCSDADRGCPVERGLARPACNAWRRGIWRAGTLWRAATARMSST